MIGVKSDPKVKWCKLKCMQWLGVVRTCRNPESSIFRNFFGSTTKFRTHKGHKLILSKVFEKVRSVHSSEKLGLLCYSTALNLPWYLCDFDIFFEALIKEYWEVPTLENFIVPISMVITKYHLELLLLIWCVCLLKEMRGSASWPRFYLV